VETRLVNVALNVMDAKGAPVGGLNREDFQIFEDGKPQEIRIFEREATTPLSIVLAIDTSESVMTSERLEKEAARHFVNALLREQDELDLMEFSDVVRELVPFTNQKKRIEAGIGQVQQGDATALYDAVYLASERLSETSVADGRRRVVVLITDGGDTVKGARYSQAMEQAQRAGAMVYSIIIVPIAADAGRNIAGEHALIQMAQDTGGKYYYAKEPKDLEPAFRHVSDDLRTQYLLGYYAPKRGRDNSYRRIEVRMEDSSLRDKYDLRYRTGYYADAR
jgi:Ca-activated chloride channel family protein